MVPPSVDAQLVSIGTEARRAADHHHRLLGKWWEINEGDPGLDQLAENLLVPHDRLCKLSEQALAIKATTPEAWRAKAEIVRHFLILECERSDGQMVFGSSNQEIAWSLVCDMTGRA